MADRFDKFTERARRVLTIAQAEAVRLKHNYIGTEHVLLGLLKEGDSVGVKVLTNLGVEPTELRVKIEGILGQGDHPVTANDIGLTPRAKLIIELAVDEARVLHHTYIGTEHLLLGLVREGQGIVAASFKSLGITLEKARAEVARLMAPSAARSNVADQAPPPPGLPPMDSATRAEALIAELGREEALNLIVDLARLLRDPDSQEPEAPPPPGLPPTDPFEEPDAPSPEDQ